MNYFYKIEVNKKKEVIDNFKAFSSSVENTLILLYINFNFLNLHFTKFVWNIERNRYLFTFYGLLTYVDIYAVEWKRRHRYLTNFLLVFLWNEKGQEREPGVGSVIIKQELYARAAAQGPL